MEAVADIYGNVESHNKNWIFEMELNRYYDDTDPFINKKLFYVFEDRSNLEAKVFFNGRQK